MTTPVPSISAKLIKPLYKQLTKIWETRDKEFDMISDIFGDPRMLARYYIQPDCQQHNPTDYDEDSIRSCVRSEIFNTINDFLERNTVEHDGRNQMFVLADAGMGKTSLFMMLKLSQMLSFWPKDYGCLLLKLDEKTLERINTQKNKAKTVLLLDALDEDPLARGRIAERLQELLAASSHFRHTLISCRTQFFPDTGLDAFGRPGKVVVGTYTCPMIFLSLFNDSQVHSYLVKRFPDPWHNRLTKCVDPRRERAEKLLHSMQSLQFRPLLLAHIEDLLESHQTHWNSYTIYEALVKVWLQREIRKMDRQDIKPIPSERNLWDACRLIAVYLQSVGKRALSESELAQLIAKLPDVAHLKHLDFGGRSLLNRTSDKDYRFAHYSIQEFFVANAACMETLASDWKLCLLDSSPFSLPKLTAQIISFIRCFNNTIIPKVFFSFNLQELKPDQFIFQDRLENGSEGPKMIIIPPIDSQVHLQMSLLEDEKKRLSQVSVNRMKGPLKAFALSQDEISIKQILESNIWGEYLNSSDIFDYEGTTFLSILIELYIEKLSKLTGENYRLPSEEELGYASFVGFIPHDTARLEPTMSTYLYESDLEFKLEGKVGLEKVRYLLTKSKYINTTNINTALFGELKQGKSRFEKAFIRVARDL